MAGEAEGSKRAVDIFEAKEKAGDLLVAKALYDTRRYTRVRHLRRRGKEEMLVLI